MNCWKRFDFVAVSIFSGNHERLKSVMAEFNRVGLDVTTFWGCKTAYDNVIERNIRHKRVVVGSYLNITLKHLQMVKTAYEVGAEHALFFEDDVRFLRDTALLERLVNALPEDYDVALFDWVQRNKATDEDYRAINDAARDGKTWVRFKDLRSCAFYSLSRKGMIAYIDALEGPANHPSMKLKICDQHWWDILKDGSLKGYCCCPCAGIQGVPGGSSPYEDMWKRYKRSGMRREDYAD